MVIGVFDMTLTILTCAALPPSSVAVIIPCGFRRASHQYIWPIWWYTTCTQHCQLPFELTGMKLFFPFNFQHRYPKHAEIAEARLFSRCIERVVVVVGKDTLQCTQIVAVVSIYLSIYLFVSSLSFVRSPLAIAIPKDQNRFHGKYLQCLYVWDHRSTPACSNLQRNKCAFRFFTFFSIVACCPSFFRLLSFFFFVSTCFFFYVSCY